MKRLLLFSLILSLGLASYSQYEPIVMKNAGVKTRPYHAVNDQIDGVSEFTNPNAVIIRGTANLGPTETRIGTTL